MYDRPSLHPLFREICYLLEHVEMHELNWTELDYNFLWQLWWSQITSK